MLHTAFSIWLIKQKLPPDSPQWELDVSASVMDVFECDKAYFLV